jgi:hypothetical protein
MLEAVVMIWLRRVVPDTQGLIMEEFENVPFAAGAAIALLLLAWHRTGKSTREGAFDEEKSHCDGERVRLRPWGRKRK